MPFDPPKGRRPNALASLDLDRRADLREDDDWLQRQLRDDGARLLVIREGRALLGDDGRLARLGWQDLQELSPDRRYVSFLGLEHPDQPLFAISLEADEEPAAPGYGARFAGLRRIASSLDRHESGLAAYARALDLWQRDHRFCGRCGGPTTPGLGGFRLRCSNAECAREHFPRLDPAVIVIVGCGDKCLLGRQPAWPPGRYSTLAGFVEPGESLEDAVAREVAEESGVRVAQSHYHSSQPWPFPSSLMVGFVADAADDHIEIGDELEDVRWFDPDELKAGIDRGEIGLPFTASVSYRLIRHWMRERHGIDIDDWDAGYRL